MNATTAIIQDKRIVTNENTYAIKLRVTFNRVQKYYPLNFHLSVEDWEKMQQPNLRGKLKEIKLVCNKFEQRAVEIIRQLPDFTFTEFNKRFLTNVKAEKSDVFSFFEAYIKELNSEERIGTASSYNNAFVSFKNFLDDKRRKSLPFDQVTPDFLNKYEKWMVDQDNSLTTVGIYTRSLRTIINQAIEKGLMKVEDYPFGTRKYKIPAGSNTKKALDKTDIKRIVELVPENNAIAKARDLWLFSYLSNGANIKDVSLLKYKNLDKRSIQFIRSKTERSTKQDLKPIVVMRTQFLDEIITKWGVGPIEPNNYVFGIVSDIDSPKRKKEKINQLTKTINKYMKRIGEQFGIDINLTTYVARHSYATVLKRSGASIEMISESLGHKDLKTTENYLGSFEDDVKMSFQNKLLEFE
ncbi:MAG: site-specific integrase [Cytophagales bacterium]|nr:site-specific integrase [Cytophagales bacterium]